MCIRDRLRDDEQDLEDSHYIVYLNEDGEVYDILENANWAVSGGVVDTVNTVSYTHLYCWGRRRSF